jgi:2-polyprenyl-6-methoxyphenol hydroxylase-like FAD-dependent oxidoreductase
MGRSERFAIVGGGIGGLSVAIAMQKKGYNVSVLESAPLLKPIGAGLALAGNAVKAFIEMGISEDVLNAGSVLKKLSIKDPIGRILAETDSEKISAKYNVVNNFTIHRADLHRVLLSHLSEGTVQLNKSVADFIQTSSFIKIIFQDGSTTEADYVIACDGVHSAFRKKLIPGSKPRYAGYTCWRAVINDIPPGLDVTETSETWGPGSRFGIAPLNNGRLYWFACLNAQENDPVMRGYGIEDLRSHFRYFHSPIPEILDHTKSDQLIWNDIIDIKPVKRFAFDNIVLMGDAAHATTPNMGQGACMAIEDAAVLANTLEKYKSAKEAFKIFEEKRIRRTTAIVKGSWQLGRLAQLENKWLIKMRNTLLRITPPSVAEKQMKFIQDISFQ